MPGIKYSDNMMEYIGQLRKAGIAIQDAYADAVNKAANTMAVYYKRSLTQKTRLRNKVFTLGSIRVLKAHAKHSTGDKLRSMDDINAIVGVMQLRGGEHYLATMEIGGVKRGSKKTGGKATIPMDTARGGDRSKPILPKYRITKNIPEQMQNILKQTRNPRQTYAMLYSLAKRGMKPGTYQTQDGIYHITNRKVTMIRRADKDTVDIKSTPLFEGATYTINQNDMDRFFAWAAKKRLEKL